MSGSLLALLGAGKASGSPVPPFVGPLDGVSNILAAYSLRRLLSSYTGPLIRIRDTTTDGELDIGYVADGSLDTAAITAFLGAHSGAIPVWYEQKNGNSAVQATAAKQPSYAESAINGFPGIYSPANTAIGLASTSQVVPTGGPLTLCAVYNPNNPGNGNPARVAGGPSGGFNWLIGPYFGNLSYYNGAFINGGSYTNGTALQQSIVQTVSGGQAWKNGTSVGTNGNTTIPEDTHLSICGDSGSLESSASYVGELVFVQTSTGSVRTTIEATQKAYWGTP